MRHRVEIWNAANTERQAIARNPAVVRIRSVLKGEESLEIQLPLDDPAAAALAEGSIVRIQRIGTAADFTLWRVAKPTRARIEDGATMLRATADALWMDFRHGLVRQRQADGRSIATFGLEGMTPQQILEDTIIPAADGAAVTFVLGVVEAAQIADRVSISFERTTPLAALRALEEAAGAEAQFRPNATGTSYFVDLLARTGNAASAELRYGKNVLTIERTTDDAAVENRLYAFGGGLLTLADMTWEIATITGGNVVTFATRHPVFEDGAHVGAYFSIPGKGTYAITASDAGAGTLTLTIGANPALAIGDTGYLSASAIGAERMPYIESPAAIARAGGYRKAGIFVAPDIADAKNLLANGDLVDWTGGVPDGWSVVNGCLVAEDADSRFTQYGGTSAYCIADAADEGLISDAFPIEKPEDRPYAGLVVGMTVTSGKVRAELVHSDGNIYPLEQRIQNEGEGVYITLKASLHTDPLPDGTAQVRIVAHGGPAEWHLDAVMVTPKTGDATPDFVRESGAAALWDRAVAELADRSAEKVEYTAAIADLYLIDPERWPYDDIDLGDDILVRDPEIGNATQRIVEISRDLIDPAQTRITVAPSVRQRIPDPYRPPLAPVGGSSGRGGATAPEPPRVPAILQHAAQIDETDGLLYINALANERTATIQLRTKAVRTDPYPTAASATIADRSGVFGGIAVVPNTPIFYELRALDAAGVPGLSAEGAVNPTDATGIHWLGEFASAPADPDVNDAYRNTTDGIVYIWTGTAWEIMVRDGLPGTGTGLEVRYSGPAAGDNIASTFNPALHVYMQVRRTDQAWPTEWAQIVGEDGAPGADGVYFDYRFRVTATQPATPTGTNPANWFDAPPAHNPNAGDILWMSRALKDAATGALLGTWSTPVQMTGPQGPSGQDGADGPPGTPALMAVLTNDAHTIPTAVDGSGGNFAGAVTTAIVYHGTADDSANWACAAAPSAGVTGSLTGKTYTVTAMTTDTGYVDLTLTRAGYPTLVVRFSLAKAKQGAIGSASTAYWLITDAAVIRRSAAGAFTPTAITVQGRSATGTAAPVAYAGRFIIATSPDGSTWTNQYTSAANESSRAYTIPAGTAAVRVRLYQAGGTTNLLDEEVVPVVNDGPPGDTFGHPPNAHIVALAATDLTMDLRYSGTLGLNAVGPLQWRRRIDREGGPEGAWGPGAGDGWVTASAGNALPYTEAGLLRDPRWDRIVVLEVRDANGQLTPARFVIMPADIRRGGIRGYGAIEEPVPGGGYNIAPTVEDSSGREIRRFYGKTLPGDPDNISAIADGGGYRKPTVNEATGGGRAYAAIDTDNDLVTGLKPIALVDGRSARDVRLLAEKPGHNLLVNPGFEAGDVGWGTGSGFYIENDPANARSGNWVTRYQHSGAGGPNYSPSVNLVVNPHERFRITAWIKSGAGTGAMRIAMRWYDGTGTTITTGTAVNATATNLYTKWSGIVTAPAGAVSGRLDIGENAFDNSLTPWYIDDVSIVRIVETDEALRGGTTIDSILQNVTDAGHAGSGMQDSGGRTINRFFGKALVGDPDHLDGVPEGTTYRRTTVNEKTGAARGYNALDSSNRLATSAAAGATDSGGRAINRFFGKALTGNPDTLDSVPEGASFVRTTPTEKTGAARGAVALNSSNELVTSVNRAADVDGIMAYLAARQSHGLFLETFSAIPPGMSSTSNITIVGGQGVTGPHVMRVSGQYRYWYTANGGITIPYDPSKLHRLRVRVRVVTNDASGTNMYFYAGLQYRDANLAMVGGNHYLIASGVRPYAANGWVEYTGWLKGHGAIVNNANDPRNPTPAPVGAAVICPLLLINYSTPNGQVTDVDYFAIDVFDEEAERRLYGTIDDAALLAEGTSGRQAGGTIAKSIPKGVIGGTCYHKQGIVFADPYQNTPQVIFLVPAAIENRAKWGTKAQVDAGTASGAMPSNAFLRPRPVAANLSPTGFTADLYIEAKGAAVARTANFAAPTSGIGAGSTTGNATPLSAQVPALDDQYRARVNVQLTNNSAKGETWSGTIVVALEAQVNGGSWVEIGTSSVGFFVPAQQSLGHTLNVSGSIAGIAGGNDNFRVRLKSVTAVAYGDAAMNVLQHLNWTQDTGAQYASMTPDGSADAIPYLVIAES